MQTVPNVLHPSASCLLGYPEVCWVLCQSLKYLLIIGQRLRYLVNGSQTFGRGFRNICESKKHIKAMRVVSGHVGRGPRTNGAILNEPH
jgi:hypothetical protein